MKCLLLCVGGGIFVAAQSAQAGSLFNIDPGSDVSAQDSIHGIVGSQTTDASSGSALAATPAGPFSAMTSLSSSESSLTIDSTDVRNNNTADYSQSQWGIDFTPTQDLDYTIAGTYSSQFGGSLSTYNVSLAQGASSLFSGQAANSGIQNLNLSTNVASTGSLTGLLQAGVTYEYSGTDNITSPGNNGTDSAAGINGISFTPANDRAPVILAAAANYRLIGTPIVAGGGPSVPNPGVDVSLNPQPLPPFPDPGADVDLTNPGDPVYTNPAVASLYTLDFGMNAGGPVAFTVPGPTPPDPNSFSFTAMGPGGDPYTIALQIGGGVVSPGSFVELNPQPLPPFPDPGYGFVQFQFSIEGEEDPTVSYQVSSGDTVFGFATVPEPASAGLLMFGGLTFLGRRRRRGGK